MSVMKSAIRVSPLLQLALLIDAVATCAVGLGTALFPVELAAATHLPQWLLLSAGVFMIAYALLAALLSRCETLPRWAVWGVIAGNALWAIELHRAGARRPAFAQFARVGFPAVEAWCGGIRRTAVHGLKRSRWRSDRGATRCQAMAAANHGRRRSRAAFAICSRSPR